MALAWIIFSRMEIKAVQHFVQHAISSGFMSLSSCTSVIIYSETLQQRLCPLTQRKSALEDKTICGSNSQEDRGLSWDVFHLISVLSGEGNINASQIRI